MASDTISLAPKNVKILRDYSGFVGLRFGRLVATSGSITVERDGESSRAFL